MVSVYSTNGMCWNIPSTCVRGIENINLKKKISIFFIIEINEINKTFSFNNNNLL